MRTRIKTMLLPIGLWAGCIHQSKQNQDAIPGTYVNQAKSQYSTASDTLVIAKNNNACTVTRKTGFRRIVNGRLQPEEHKAKSFIGTWDQDKQILQLVENGIIIRFDGDGLEVQNSKYRRL